MKNNMTEYRLDPVTFAAERGAAWKALVPESLGPGDTVEHPERSALILFEGDKPLAPAHALHDYIRESGRGAYSHWREGQLYFSTSDGSDPRANGRRYLAFADIATACTAMGRNVAGIIEKAMRRRYCSEGPNWATPFNQNCQAFGDPLAAAQYDKQIYDGWTGHLERWARRSIGLNILELGPGHSLGAQVLLAELGNRITVADPFPPSWHASFHPVVYRHLAMLAGGSAALERAADAGSFAAIPVRQVPEPAENLASLQNEEFDVVLSNATLEHVADLDRVCSELARITKRGGLNLHQIDLAYHKDRERPLDHLLASDADFLAEAKAANYEYGNRWRKSEFLARFNRFGFEIIHAFVSLRADTRYLAEIGSRRTAGSRYRRWPLDDLGALNLFVVAERMTGARRLIPLLRGQTAVAFQSWRKRGGSPAV